MQPILINELCRGLGSLPDDPTITSVVTDSRKAGPGSLFVCIKGARTDGHEYAPAVLEKGAAAVLAQHPVDGVPLERCILADDPLDAMIVMGGNYRDRFSPVLVGVTGSVGKTTTKEFCYAVFSAFGSTLKTEGNQNNEIGVPNTLFRLHEGVEYAVVEMGMQGLGEIEKLTRAAKPCGAIISTVGQSHLEQLGTRENILKAKMEICSGMTPGSPLVLNGDNDLLPGAAVPADLRRVLFAVRNPDADVRAVGICQQDGGMAFSIQDRENGEFRAFIPTVGEHNVMDALSAYTLATRLGLDPARAARALEDYQTTGHRQNLVTCRGVQVLEDCYNASPDSMRAGLSALKSLSVRGRRIAVLGDMFELGSASESGHREVGDACRQAGVDLLVTVGDEIRFTHRRAQELGVPAVHCADKEEAVALLRREAKEGDAILVKASHGMAFETILDGFYQA